MLCIIGGAVVFCLNFRLNLGIFVRTKAPVSKTAEDHLFLVVVVFTEQLLWFLEVEQDNGNRNEVPSH
jgi:hypothetical protein